MGWTWNGEHVLLFAIKQLWEVSVLQVYFLNCVGRKNFLCTPHEKKPSSPPPPLPNNDQSLPGPTRGSWSYYYRSFFAGPSLTEWFRELTLELEPPFFLFCPCSPLSPQRNQNLTYQQHTSLYSLTVSKSDKSPIRDNLEARELLQFKLMRCSPLPKSNSITESSWVGYIQQSRFKYSNQIVGNSWSVNQIKVKENYQENRLIFCIWQDKDYHIFELNILNINITNLGASIFIHTMHAWFTFLSLGNLKWIEIMSR